MDQKDIHTKELIKNAFITNIIGVAMQYSPNNYKPMSELLKQTAVVAGADLFNVCVR